MVGRVAVADRAGEVVQANEVRVALAVLRAEEAEADQAAREVEAEVRP
jgi:hypothetical protein